MLIGPQGLPLRKRQRATTRRLAVNRPLVAEQRRLADRVPVHVSIDFLGQMHGRRTAIHRPGVAGIDDDVVREDVVVSLEATMFARRVRSHEDVVVHAAEKAFPQFHAAS